MSKTYNVKYKSPFTGLFTLDMVTIDKQEAKQRREKLMEYYDFVTVEVKDES